MGAALALMTGLLAVLTGLTAPPADAVATSALRAATASSTIAFRGADQRARNRRAVRATVPGSVVQGDGMLLFVTSGTAGVSIATPPAGWVRERTRRSGTDTRTTLYSRVATGDDAGSGAAVRFSARTTATITLLAYAGTGADPVGDVGALAETVRRARHTTPGADVGVAGSHVVSYWAEKAGSTSTGWTLPAGQVRRSLVAGSGSGRISSVASDSAVPEDVGASGARTARSVVASRKATMWSVVLQPRADPEPNVAPVASFTVGCSGPTCTVDGSGSSDTSPGSVASYAWDFGDGSTGTGVSTSHTYASGGPMTITLVVTDDQGLDSAPVERTADPTVTPPVSGTPGHDRLVPDRPRTDTPRIGDGEINDIEVVPSLNRVFIAGSFTSIQNNTATNTTTYDQAGLASYDLDTGLVDADFRPTFNGGVAAVEATPDGTKLFVGGSFNTVDGDAKQKVASLDLTTGAPLSDFDFSRSTNNQVQSLAATDSTLYVGGRYSRINGVLRTGVAAVDTTSGAVDQSFDNSLSGGIGVNGQLGVPQLKLTHDESKLLVIHTGRQIDGQDRLGMGIIDTATQELLPWRSTLWDENLARVGGVTRICCGDIAPDDSYFVVTSGSGGDAPPISDTVVAYPLDAASLQDDDVQPLWISRHFDSIYSVAITEVAIYVGGHFQWVESPTSNDPWPGLDNVGYGTGQGLSGYGLGDQVVRRDHIAALDPTDGKSLEWNPNGGSNSFEGDKAMEATPRGLFVGGDGMFKGGVRTGRVGFFDFDTVPHPDPLPDTTITTPIEGRVVASGESFSVTGTAEVATGSVGRVRVQVRDRNSGQYLTAGNAWTGTTTWVDATLEPGTTTRGWHLDDRVVDDNRELLVTAQAFTAATGGTGDATRATKKFESFGTDDQTPTTSISAPRGILASTSFTMSGSANDDNGVSSLTYWFRDAQGRYLQDDGTVGAIYHTFRGTPDVIGGTSTTWSYDVVLPHEGEWRGSATAVDTAGQADLRSATRDWTIDSNAVPPTVSISQPVEMTPPFSVPTVTVEPGGQMTFAGSAADDEGLKDVEVTLRNRTTGENLGNDGSWGTDVSRGNYRVSPVNIAGNSYEWTWTTPFVLTPGSYDFTVRATDDNDLTTSSSDRGVLTISAEYPGDAPPSTTMSFTPPVDQSLTVDLSGTAADDVGLDTVQVSLQDRDTGRYLQANGSMGAAVAYREADLVLDSVTSLTWSLPPITLPSGGDWRFAAVAFDSRGQQDPTAATASYKVYPGDGLPGLNPLLGQPQDGATFDDGRIVVTGRADDADDPYAGIAAVQVGVVNSAGLSMSSSGTFTSATPSWRNAFLNSPGSAGSNFSYTTPVIPAGTYTVLVRSVDVHDQVMDPPRTATGVVVTQPPNDPPVPSFTHACEENVCTFDGRSSTDENTSSLSYSWSFGQGSGSGPLPTKTYTAPGDYEVTLTVQDEWGLAATSEPQVVSIEEPTGNQAPVPTFIRSCTGLTCAVSSQGTADPDPGDTFSSVWDWGDGSAPSTSTSPSHTYEESGTYTIVLTTTDGWGNAASTSQEVVLSEPVGNTAPHVELVATCAAFTICQMSSDGTLDAEGDTIRYAWDFGDGGTSSSANPSHTYAAAGTYSVELGVTDVWGRSASETQVVTIVEPETNNAPTAVLASSSCTSFTTCAVSAAGSSDPDTATGDDVWRYVWSWGDGTEDTTTSAETSHVYDVAGTYDLTLTVVDRWGRASTPVEQTVTTPEEPADNEAPTASLATSCVGFRCSADPSGTADDASGIRSYVYDWGDGTSTTTTRTTARSYTYAAAGTYTVTLTVTDNWGRTATATSEVTVG
ncbi:PKD domain-containing protein [Nocardioides aestuarii]|uniref:PKD domain-containing protein n=1 Tax=Nocardioides aestuarii TaxID=252231 RepID=A0ABW4TKC9_9ACTN